MSDEKSFLTIPEALMRVITQQMLIEKEKGLVEFKNHSDFLKTFQI